MKQSIEEFGKLLVRLVRDAAVKGCDQNTNLNARSPVTARWREAAGGQKTIIPDCVDETLFHLLQAIDQGSIRLNFRSTSGELVDLNAEGMGELAGMYMASGGWRAQYAKERFNDDFADLA